MILYLNTTQNIGFSSIVGLIIGYLIGSMLFAILISKLFKINIREKFSGNPGATNVFRVLGLIPSFIVFLFDASKGALSIGILIILRDHVSFFSSTYVLAAGLGAVIGHCYPLYFKFKGGKGGATILGVFAIMNYWLIPIGFVFWITLNYITKYVSFATVLSALLGVIFTTIPIIGISIWNSKSDPNVLWYINTLIMLIAALIVMIKHKQNFIRIKEHSEPHSKIYLKIKKNER